jgi:hypothetical protein
MINTTANINLISHRGNTSGPKPELENSPDHIAQALDLGFEVEVDVWIRNGVFLGHDEPQYEVNLEFLGNDKFWCHAKNLDALIFMLDNQIHCFWHEEDDVTLTSRGVIWAYPGKQPIKNSIAVMPEINNDDTLQCAGICSDYILNYKKNII